jgi:hypothetical protein
MQRCKNANVIVISVHRPANNRDQTNLIEKFRWIYTMGKHQNTVGCVCIIFQRPGALINNGIFLPILFRGKICFMINEALVAPKSAEILHPFDLDIARVRDCKL